MSVLTGTSALFLPFSSAHCCLAPSIWRRLLMHALVWEVLRARTKLGMAMAASRPMMATTIMISTSVKPDLREVFLIIALPFCNAQREQAASGSVRLQFTFTYCLL